jgi:hypothetical protein
MSVFIDSTSNLHPYECDGPGECLHCDREISTKHDPNTCALCDDDGRYRTGERDGDLSDTARLGAGV